MGVIQARYGSSRFPGKPLQEINGKPMVWWVYSHVSSSNVIDKAIVATEHDEVVKTCNKYSIPVMLTSSEHNTPTDRMWEVSEHISADRYIFVGGDEPLVRTESISQIAQIDDAPVVHAITEIKSAPEVIDFTNIKAVVNNQGTMLYSTRSPIPYPRGNLFFKYYKTVGVISFSKDALNFFHHTPKSLLEKTEENDLIRFIENGIRIHAVDINSDTLSVDTPKDLEKVRSLFKNKGEL